MQVAAATQTVYIDPRQINIVLFGFFKKVNVDKRNQSTNIGNVQQFGDVSHSTIGGPGSPAPQPSTSEPWWKFFLDKPLASVVLVIVALITVFGPSLLKSWEKAGASPAASAKPSATAPAAGQKTKP